MTQPGDSVTKFLFVYDASTSLAVTGLTDADFTFTGLKKEAGASPTTYALNSTLTEIGSGFYAWEYDKPGAAAHDGQHIVPDNANHIVMPVTFSGEVESYDRDALAALQAQPVGGAGSSFAFGSRITLELTVYRQREVAQAFSGADLSTAVYTNWRMGIRSVDQTTVIWDCDSGKLDGFTITGDASGNLTITIPESLIGPVYTTWTASRAYALGDYVRPVANNGFIYEATVAGTAAGSEPSFPTTEGNTVTDGGVTWTCRKRSLWVASVARVVGDMVRPTTSNGLVYRCTVAGTSSGSEPTWPTTPGATVTDGTVTWRCLSDPFAALAAGDDSTDLRYDVTADNLSTAKTRAIIPSSTLTLLRRENGA